MTDVKFPSEVAYRIFQLLDDAKATLLLDVDTGQVGSLLYGDQNRVPVTPTVCIEAGQTTRTLAGVGGNGRTENVHTTYIIVYYAKVDTNQVTKRASEICAEDIVRLLDQNVKLERGGDGGIVIHGFVSQIEPGYQFKNEGKTLMQTVRLTWTGKTKTILGA